MPPTLNLTPKQTTNPVSLQNYYFNSKMREKYFEDIDYGVDEEAVAREKKERELEELGRNVELEKLAAERNRAMRMMNKNPPKQPTKPHLTSDALRTRSTYVTRLSHRARRAKGFIPPKDRRKAYEKEKRIERRREREEQKYREEMYSSSESSDDES
jgi:hypothetical protein